MRSLGLLIAAVAATTAMQRAHRARRHGRGRWADVSHWTRAAADAWQALTEDAVITIAARVLA